jgi:hypothetical protein
LSAATGIFTIKICHKNEFFVISQFLFKVSSGFDEKDYTYCDGSLRPAKAILGMHAQARSGMQNWLKIALIQLLAG